MNRNVFRVLVLIFIVLLATILLDAFVLIQEYPESALAYLEWFYAFPRTPLETILPYIGLGMIGVTMISTVGMMFFVNIARHAFSISIVILIIIDSVLGISLGVPQMFSVITLTTNGLSSLIAGLIIALSYWSEIGNEFKKI